MLAGEERREQITRLVEQALCRSRNIVGIYNTGLGNTQIAEALARHRREGDVCWITHERYNTTRQQLAKGSLALTLDQNTRQHAQLAIDLMLRHLSPATSRKPMPTVKSTLSSTAPRTWTKACGALPDNTGFPRRVNANPPGEIASKRCLLLIFAHLCGNVRCLSKFCYCIVLKFSFQLFTYKSFKCLVNEINGLKSRLRRKWTDVSKIVMIKQPLFVI